VPWYECIVNEVGPAIGGETPDPVIYINLTDTAGSFADTWFYALDPVKIQVLDVGIAAINGNKRVSVAATTPNPGGAAPYTDISSIYEGGTTPYIESTTIYEPDGNPITPVNGQVPLTVGVRYTVGVHINADVDATYTAGVEVNSSLNVPASLNLLNRVSATHHWPVTGPQTRQFAFTPSQPGSFPLGFQLRDNRTRYVFNRDNGVRVSCSATNTGLYGRVTSRVTGAAIGGASITTGSLSTTSAPDGRWYLPTASGGPLRVTISKAGYSSTIAVNVTVPAGSGVRIDTPLEDPFSDLRLAGLTYTTHIDYSRGRTILHTVRINPMSSSGIVSLAQASDLSTMVNLHDIATAQDSLVIINGGYFDGAAGADHGRSVGYLYINGFTNPEVLKDDTKFAEPGPPDNVIQPANVRPMLTVAGGSVHQQINVVNSESDFTSTASSQWHRDSGGNPIWDVSAPFGVSDVTYALQAAPTLLMNGSVIWRGDFDDGSGYEQYFPRTAVGVGPGAGGNTLYLVVADGEGVNGGNGATWNQLGELFRDVLGATAAMNFDGGESTEMVLKGASGQRIVNTLTSENNSAPDGYVPSGVVANYLKIGL
jgi:Phosphodiester glycosidase/Carboxypeptidase regulatory-like domain